MTGSGLAAGKAPAIPKHRCSERVTARRTRLSASKYLQDAASPAGVGVLLVGAPVYLPDWGLALRLEQHGGDGVYQSHTWSPIPCSPQATLGV